jgi:hypothetical protein
MSHRTFFEDVTLYCEAAINEKRNKQRDEIKWFTEYLWAFQACLSRAYNQVVCSKEARSLAGSRLLLALQQIYIEHNTLDELDVNTHNYLTMEVEHNTEFYFWKHLPHI